MATANHVETLIVLQMNPLIPWAIYVALQVVIRGSQRKISISRNSTMSAIPSNAPRRDDSSTIPRNKGGRAESKTSDQPSDALNDARTLDSMHFLLFALMDMKVSNPLAKMLEKQVNQEMTEGEAATRERVVGLVDLPLVHPSTRSFDQGSDMDISFNQRRIPALMTATRLT